MPGQGNAVTATDWVWPREGVMVLLLTLLVLGAYFCRVSTMYLSGEEPRRAQVAVDIIDSGDWVVPHDQGQVFFSRPPLQNWLIALAYLAFGERDTFGARLPSLIATWLMVLIIYGYSRSFLPRTGSLAAAAAFATFAEVLQECRSAETEAVFTLTVSGALLLWHWGMTRGWPEAIAWSLGYGLAAMGMLAKSLQAPFYFLVSVTAFLVLTRQWRRLFSLAHLAGIACGAAVLAVWVIPFAQRLGIGAVSRIWFSDAGPRLFEWEGFLGHLGSFPAEWFGCTLPWSPLLLAFARRPMRASIGAAWPQVLFMTIVLVLGAPTCWLPPGGATRYLLPLYPCLAVLVGLVVQRLADAQPESILAIIWRRSLLGYAILMLIVAAAVIVVGLLPYRWAADWAEPPLVAASFAAVFVGLAWLMRRLALSALPWRSSAAVLTLAGFMIVLYVGPVVDARVRRGIDAAADVAQLQRELPPGTSLVSLGPVHAELRFYWQHPVELVPPGDASRNRIPPGAYFCFNALDTFTPQVPFAYEHVKTIPVGRFRDAQPADLVIVGRRARMDETFASR